MEVPAFTQLKGQNRAEIAKVTSVAPSVVAIVVALIVAIFIVWPKFSEVLRLRVDNRDLAERAENLERKVISLQALDRDVLETQLTAANSLLPSEKGVFLMISQIERSAGLSGILLNRVEVTPGSVGGSSGSDTNSNSAPAPKSSESKKVASVAPKIQLKISISSDYNSFLQFINTMLENPRVVTIADLSVSSASSGTSQVRSSLLIEAYWQSTPNSLPAVETPIEQLTPSELERLSKVEATEASPSAYSSIAVPSVPYGKEDLFAPF